MSLSKGVTVMNLGEVPNVPSLAVQGIMKTVQVMACAMLLITSVTATQDGKVCFSTFCMCFNLYFLKYFVFYKTDFL